MKKHHSQFWTAISLITLALLFQNCGEKDVKLQLKQEVFLKSRKLDIEGKICLPKEYTLKKMMVINRSVLPKQKGVFTDLDLDTFADQEEASFKFDANKPQTSGQLLDGVCYYLSQSHDCSGLELTCDENRINEFGLSECDVFALNSKNTSGFEIGLDTDGDMLLDFFELVNGLDPFESDTLKDSDLDGELNIDEVVQGTDPLRAESFQTDRYDALSALQPLDDSCANSGWDFYSANHQIYDFSNVEYLNSNINHFLILYFIEKPVSDIQTERQVLFKKLELSYDKYIGTVDNANVEHITIDADEFIEADKGFFNGGSVQ